MFPYTGAQDADLDDPGHLMHQTSLMDQMNVPHKTHLLFDASNEPSNMKHENMEIIINAKETVDPALGMP